MASTADCKKLLENSDQIDHQGPWKRLSKKKADDGVERIFASTDEKCFVRMLEDEAGKLRVDRVGQTLSAVAPAAAPVAIPTPVLDGRPHVLETDAEAFQQAKKLLDNWLKSSLDYEKFEEKLGGLMASNPKALANQFLFSVGPSGEEMMGEDCFMFSLVPASFWKKEKCVPDFFIPMDSIVPGEVESPNDTGTFISISATSRQELAQSLLDAGFQWSAGLQDLEDRCSGGSEQDNADFRAWMTTVEPASKPRPGM